MILENIEDLIKLIEKCSQTSVSSIKLEGIDVTFSVPSQPHILSLPTTTGDKEENLSPKEIQEDDSQLMIDDPLKYEDKIFKGEIENAEV
jgi:hypothetical protein